MTILIEEPNYDTIEPESLKFQREPLGHGAFGEVFCAELNRPNSVSNSANSPALSDSKNFDDYNKSSIGDEDEEYVAVKFSTVYNTPKTDLKTSEAHEQEIRMLAKCSHPYIVKFIGVVESGYNFAEIGTKWSKGIILECADMNLYEMLHGWEEHVGRREQTTEDWDQICKNQWKYTSCHVFMWMHQIVTALEYLVTIKVVHRDLKPQNILMFDYGRMCKITDFGIACALKTAMTSGK